MQPRIPHPDAITAALATLIPGGVAENMSAIITEATPHGDQHTWGGSIAGLAERIHASTQAATVADPWHVPPAPPVPLSETAAHYSPARGYATIVVHPDEVDLGDVVDHTNGLMVVTEITRRHATWSIGGYNPAAPPPFYWALGAGPAPATPPLARHVTAQPRIRVRRPATAWPRLPGHAKLITSSNPVKSGCYTLIDGYNANCACGWTASIIPKTRQGAGEALDKHRALVLTQATREAYGLADIERLEREVGDVLPWRWDHGAQAQLRGLSTAQALARLAPWAAALGVEIELSPASSGDEHFLWVDSRPVENGRPGLDIRAYPTDPPA
jgi:hypothetical protein